MDRVTCVPSQCGRKRGQWAVLEGLLLRTSFWHCLGVCWQPDAYAEQNDNEARGHYSGLHGAGLWGPDAPQSYCARHQSFFYLQGQGVRWASKNSPASPGAGLGSVLSAVYPQPCARLSPHTFQLPPTKSPEERVARMCKAPVPSTSMTLLPPSPFCPPASQGPLKRIRPQALTLSHPPAKVVHSCQVLVAVAMPGPAACQQLSETWG